MPADQPGYPPLTQLVRVEHLVTRRLEALDQNEVCLVLKKASVLLQINSDWMRRYEILKQSALARREVTPREVIEAMKT